MSLQNFIIENCNGKKNARCQETKIEIALEFTSESGNLPRSNSESLRSWSPFDIEKETFRKLLISNYVWWVFGNRKNV
jgi:hypothetical protein